MTRRSAATGLACLALAAALAITGRSGAGVPAPEPQSWAFAIGNGTLAGPPGEVGDRYAGFDIVVVDGEEASASEVTAVADTGATVLAYLSVGTIERWRSWFGRLREHRLAAWQDWRDEWYADTSRAAFRRALTKIASDEILVKGFDGLFLDNTDMVEARRRRGQRAGMARLVRMLDASAAPRPLFTQNGARGMLNGYPRQGVEPLIGRFEGWNREDVTWTYDFDRRRYARTSNGDRNDALAELEEIGERGLVTSATDYVRLNDGISPGECAAVTSAAGVDALPYLGDIGLTRRAVEANPPSC